MKPPNPIKYTLEEWNALGCHRYQATAQALGARSYHSNYHLCAIIHALKSGEAVDARVIDSYDGTARFTLERILQD